MTRPAATPAAEPPSRDAAALEPDAAALSLTRIIWMLLATLFAGVALAAAIMVLFPDWPDILQMALPTEIALAGAVAYAVRRTGRPWREALALWPLDRRALAPLAFVLVGAVTVFSELYLVVQRIVPVPPAFEAMLRELLQITGPTDLAATLLIAIVVAPLLEEALFRGVILHALLVRMGPLAACLWTAALFALFHLYNPWQILPTFFLGLLLGWVVLVTRTVFAGIVLHALFNAASLAVYAAPLGEEPPAADAVPWIVAGIVAVMMVGSGALCIGLVRLERLTSGGRFGDPAGVADAWTRAPGQPGHPG